MVLMKIQLGDIEEEQHPYEAFLGAIKSPATKKQYKQNLRKILFEFFEGHLTEQTLEERAKEFVEKAKKDPKWATRLFIGLVEYLRKRTELPRDQEGFVKTSIYDAYCPPLRKLLVHNDVVLNWDLINGRKGEKHSDEKTRGYTLDEIRKILNHADESEKAVILIAASSSIRIGAFDFKWKHLRPVYQYKDQFLWEDEDITESIAANGKIVCGMITVYADHYARQDALISPEALDAIEVYKDKWIQDTGFAPHPNHPFLKQHGDTPAKPLSTVGLEGRIRRVVENAGLRPQLPKGKKRHTVPLMNGFRRFKAKTGLETPTDNAAARNGRTHQGISQRNPIPNNIK
jgi:hypothetical protein